jgi:hypothetical protein
MHAKALLILKSLDRRTLIGTGNIFIVTGVVLVVGWKKSKDFMFQWQRARGTSIFRASARKTASLCSDCMHAVVLCLHSMILLIHASASSTWPLPGVERLGSPRGTRRILRNPKPVRQFHPCTHFSHQKHPSDWAGHHSYT